MRSQIPALALAKESPLIPVIVITDVEQAVPLARTLVESGIPALEITLRTPQALEAIKRVRGEVPDALLGAGTVTRPEQLKACLDLGCQFIVSPGCTPSLLQAAAQQRATLLPGVATVSEAMTAAEAGADLLKFFPANINGGVPALKAFGGPLVETKFCPTGGVSEDNMLDYLQLNNVVCVGGSWMAPSSLVESQDWEQIAKIAKRSVEKAKTVV